MDDDLGGNLILLSKNGRRYNDTMIAAVVLAAGASTRMGSAKLLLPLSGEPLVRRTVRQVAEAGFDDVLVVVGYEHPQVIAALDGLRCRYVVNAQSESGMGSSFRAAIGAIGDAEAAMFALADQPFVTRHEYPTLLDTYLKRPAASSACGTERSRRHRTCSHASSFANWRSWSAARGRCSSATRIARPC